MWILGVFFYLVSNVMINLLFLGDRGVRDGLEDRNYFFFKGEKE